MATKKSGKKSVTKHPTQTASPAVRARIKGRINRIKLPGHFADDCAENCHSDCGENCHSDCGENCHSDCGENCHSDCGTIGFRIEYIDQRFGELEATMNARFGDIEKILGDIARTVKVKGAK